MSSSVKALVSEQEWQVRVDLAACYRIVAHYGWDDLVFTHISARVPGPEHHFLINPYGLLFEEVTASNLVKVDLEGNITNTLDVSTKTKLNEYLSSVFKGLSETATTEETFEQYFNTAGKKKAQIFKSLLEFAVSATTIPLSIFTNLFYQRFSKHDYLESTLEILQQFYIKMHSDDNHYCVIPGDLCKYT